VDGKLYGRGATDMKGAIAGIIAGVRAIVSCKVVFNGEIIVAFTADEEGGSRFGAGVLIERGLEADAMLIAEPSGMDEDFDSLGLACRGVLLGKVLVHGTQMHSSLSDRGGCINASVKMAKVLVEFAENLKKYIHYESHPLYTTGPTINPGVTLDGGIFYGVIPGRASFGFDIRTIPGMSFKRARKDVEHFLSDLQEMDSDLRAELVLEKPPMDWLPPVEIRPDHPLVSSCVRSAKSVLNREPQLIGMPFSTDGVFFVKAGVDMPIISSFGPGLIKLAHAPDEYIHVQSIIDSAKIFALTAIDFLTH
jgi:acetylornithine deacetylase